MANFILLAVLVLVVGVDDSLCIWATVSPDRASRFTVSGRLASLGGPGEVGPVLPCDLDRVLFDIGSDFEGNA